MNAALRRRLILAAVAGCALAAAAAAAAFLVLRPELPPLAEVRARVTELLEAVPAPLYFLAFAVLPAFGVPLTLFYLTALPVLGVHGKIVAVLLAWAALGLNMTLANLLARGILHPAIEWVIRHRHLRIPKFKPENEWKIVLATRLSPLPFPLQNYLLALGHARWRSYLWLSLVIQGAIGLAIMLVGESILRGGLGYVLLAFCAFLVIHLVLDAIRKRLVTRERIPPID